VGKLGALGPCTLVGLVAAFPLVAAENVYEVLQILSLCVIGQKHHSRRIHSRMAIFTTQILRPTPSSYKMPLSLYNTFYPVMSLF
jgi:hypothetical protein